jgi:hypothetical protein
MLLTTIRLLHHPPEPTISYRANINPFKEIRFDRLIVTGNAETEHVFADHEAFDSQGEDVLLLSL